MKRLGIVLAVLVVLVVAADFGAKVLVENLAGRALASHRGVNGSVDVSFGGFPFLLHLKDRSFTSVSVEADDVRSGGFAEATGVGPESEAQIESVRLDLQDVTIRGDLWSDGAERVVAAAAGDGTASLSGAELNRLVPDELPARLVLLEGRVRVTAATPAGEQSVEVADDLVHVEDGGASGTLVIETPAPLQPVLIPLPTLVEGTRFESVTVERGRIVLEFSLSDVRLEL